MPKWVYSSKKIVLQKMMVEYFSTSGGEIAPIYLKIAVMRALLCTVKINNASTSALTPFSVMQHKASLNQ
jgi:hypothetical protein